MLDKIYRRDIFEKQDNTEVGVLSLFRLYLKTVYSTTVGKIVIIFSPMFVALAMSMIFPIFFSIGISQIFVTTLSAGVIWGMTYFSIRRTTFYRNMFGTRVSRFKIYFTIWLTMVFVTFWSEISFWTVTIILDQLGMTSLFENILIGVYSYDINWFKVDWFTLGYTWMGSITFVFVTCFLTREIFKTEMSFFIVLLLCILLLIPFGGIMRPVMNQGEFLEHGIQVERQSNFLFWISIFVPQYHLDMFNFAAISSGTIITGTDGVPHSIGNLKILDSFRWSTSWQWNVSILYPPLLGITLASASLLTLELSSY